MKWCCLKIVCNCFLTHSRHLYLPPVYNRLLLEIEKLHLRVSFYRFSPDLYRFLWPILFFHKWEKKINVIFTFFKKIQKFLNSNSDLINAKYVLQKQSESPLSSMLQKAVNYIFNIKNIKILRKLYPEYSGVLVGIKNNGKNNDYLLIH